MLLGYNTNGLAHHDLIEAIELIASIGYQAVAITLDHHALNPFDTDLPRHVENVRDALRRHGLLPVIETGSRFLLDPRRKHEPTLVSRDQEHRSRRIEFLCRAIDVARELGSPVVSLWSGIVHDNAPAMEVWQRLLTSLGSVVTYASENDVVLGFEPEPGMFIDTLDRFEELLTRFDSQQADSSTLQLTIDVGHVHCQGEGAIDEKIRYWANRLVNLHIEDMRRGVHEHLQFGEGEMDFPPILAALAGVGYQGPVIVELSRHSHEGPAAALWAFEFLNRIRPVLRSKS